MTRESRNKNKPLQESGISDISVAVAGRLGGIETLTRHGRKHFVAAGKLGQKVLAQRYTCDDRRRWGRIGGRPRRNTLAEMEEVRKQNPSRKEAKGGQPSSGSRTSSNPII